MCGIAGILSANPVVGLGDLLCGFSRALLHRGPDDAGFMSLGEHGAVRLWREDEAIPDAMLGMVHRRLSIIDLSTVARQPMIAADGRFAIVFNGEIYNHIELRADLEREGVQFRTHSDTEVLLALLSRKGLAGLRDVVGMYAFAFLDVARRCLTLGRDRFGIKPLNYATDGATFAFSSEFRPLLALPFVRRLADPASVFRYIRNAVTDFGDTSMFADIRQLPPGHALEIGLQSPGRPRLVPIPAPAPLAPLSPSATVERLRAIILDSVRLHLRSDAPVCATLSGGVDSGGIVGAIARVCPGDMPLPVFSYAADAGTRADELEWTRLSASHAGAALTEVRVSPDELVDDLDALILSQEQPFNTTSIWAQRQVYRRIAAAGFKVVLDGQGADELFGGYEVFRGAVLADRLRTGDFTPVMSMLATLPAHARKGAAFAALAHLLPAPLARVGRWLTRTSRIPADVDADWLARWRVTGDSAPAPAGCSYLAQDLRDAVERSSLPMLLRYADRNAMAFSLENRVPYVTNQLYAAAQALPEELIIAGDGTCKSGLRAALRGLAPDPVLDRRDKIGFETPEREWFARSPALRAALAQAAAARVPPCFHSERMEKLAAVARGDLPMNGALWRTFNLIRWTQLLEVAVPE